MPFTLSHPAAVIPLKLIFKRLSLPALVIGSTAPDFEYFFRMKSKYSHTLGGIFWFDLPLTLILLFIFYAIVKEPLISNLPFPLKSRFADIAAIDKRDCFKSGWFFIPVSAVLGSFTHILWDGFTHANGYFVGKTAFLSTSITDALPVYRLLQHTSSIIGAAVLCYYIYKLPKKAVKEDIGFLSPLSYWLSSAIITALIFLFLYFYIWEGKDRLWHTVIIFLSSCIYALTLTSAIVKLKNILCGEAPRT
jgi:hypothetical protein